MSLMLAMALAGAAAGGLGGMLSQSKRQGQADQDLARAKWMRDEMRKNRARNRRIVEGDLSVAALQATRGSKDRAMEAFQSESAAEAALGISGMSSGTPFYKLAQDVRDNAERLFDADMMTRRSLEGMTMRGGAATDDSRIQEAQMNWQVADLQSQTNYLGSALSGLMAVGTGTLQGAAVGMQISAGLEQLGIFDKPLTSGGLPDSKGNEWLYSGDEGRYGFDYPKTYLGQTLNAPSNLDIYQSNYYGPGTLLPINPSAVADSMNGTKQLSDFAGFDLSPSLTLGGLGYLPKKKSMFSLGGAW